MSAAVPNHRRTKPGGIKPGVMNTGVTGPTSQIPGLCQSAEENTQVERISGRRVGIFESDSDYVKLAKGGGHKGLLSHDTDADDKPRKPYNPPNWFGGDDSKRYKNRSRRYQTRGHKHEAPLFLCFDQFYLSSLKVWTFSLKQGDGKTWNSDIVVALNWWDSFPEHSIVTCFEKSPFLKSNLDGFLFNHKIFKCSFIPQRASLSTA